MDTPFLLAIAPLLLGSLLWQISASHIEQFLAATDEEHEPPGVLARMFIGKLFTTIPLLGRYREFREMQGQAPIGVWGFWGGLALTFGGLAVFVIFLSGI